MKIINGCIGCGQCAEVCPVEAIEFSNYTAVKIDSNKCIKCGQCKESCLGECITDE